MSIQRTVQRTSVSIDFRWAPGGLRVAALGSPLPNRSGDARGRREDEGAHQIQAPEVVFGYLGRYPLRWDGERYVSDVLAELIDTQRRGRRFDNEAFMDRILASGLPPLLGKEDARARESLGLWLRAATICSVALHLARLDPAPESELELRGELGGGPFKHRGGNELQPWAADASWYRRWAQAEFKGTPAAASPGAFRANLAAILRRRFVRTRGVKMRLDLGVPVIQCGTLAWARLELADRLLNAPTRTVECPECRGRFVPQRAGHEFCRPTCRRTYRRRGGPRPDSTV